jgi:hypothetical protein
VTYDAGMRTAHQRWPADALARLRAGEIVMLPPTSVTLDELANFDSVPAVLAAACAGRKLGHAG